MNPSAGAAHRGKVRGKCGKIQIGAPGREIDSSDDPDSCQGVGAVYAALNGKAHFRSRPHRRRRAIGDHRSKTCDWLESWGMLEKTASLPALVNAEVQSFAHQAAE